MKLGLNELGFAGFAGVLVLITAFVSDPVQEPPSLSCEAREKLNLIVSNTTIPLKTRILDEAKEENPFQGLPPDASIRSTMKKRWKNLTQRERMLAFGWVNPAAEDFVRLPVGEKRREFMKAHPTAESRGWTMPTYNPVRNTLVLYLRFYKQYARPPKDIWQLLAFAGYERAIDKIDPDNPGEFAWQLISPVTGKVLEFSDNPDKVGAGNLLIVPVPRKKIEELGRSVQVQDYASGKFLPLSEVVEVMFYYQVFGEEGVIRSGEFGIKKDGAFFFS